MADTKISALPPSTTPLAGTEVLPIVQGGATVKVAVSNLTAGRSFDALGMILTSTDAGAAAAPLLELYRDSATPAASDTLGEIEFNGEDSAGNKQAYALFHGSILSPTSGAEQGQLHFETATAGALTEKMIIGTTNLVINEIGAIFNVRIEGDTDANLFYTDATNSRVGVGTISPAQKLDVAGSINLTGDVIAGSGKLLVGTSSSPTQQAVIYRTDSSTANGALRLDGNGNYAGIQFAQSGNLRGSLSTDAAGLYMTHESNIYFYTGGPGNISGTNRMLIDSSGIVTMSAYGAGAATFSATGVISSVSDETWKIKDGVPTDPDAMLKKLEPGYWYYNDEKKETFGVERQLGFYAQNVNAAIGPEAAPTPEPITTKNKDGSETTVTKPWGYYDRSVLAITVMSLQKALATIETLTARITALEAQ
jgi:hypothetical protein